MHEGSSCGPMGRGHAPCPDGGSGEEGALAVRSANGEKHSPGFLFSASFYGPYF